MAGRRLALVIGSQCAALLSDRQLSFLPAVPDPVEPATLAAPQRLLIRLRDLLVDGQSGPGLLLNPTRRRRMRR